MKECSVSVCEEIVQKLRSSLKIKKILEENSSSSTLKILCRPCSNIGPEGGARAVLIDSVPLEVVLCTNRLNTKDIEEVLVHELIHVYDYTNRRCDLSTCEGLAFTEVRAAREAECNQFFPFQWLKKQCVRNNSTRSTANLFPNDAAKCVDTVLEKAMLDHAPFDSPSSRNSK